jgi:hypothetical protein
MLVHYIYEEYAITMMTKSHKRISHWQVASKFHLISLAVDKSGGHRYCVSSICDATNMVWGYMMKRETDLPTLFGDFLIWMQI